MNRLSGQRLLDIRINANNGSTEFKFDLGATLHVRRFERDDADMWTLYKPSGYVVAVRGDGTYTHAKGNTQKVVPMALGRPIARTNPKAIDFS